MADEREDTLTMRAVRGVRDQSGQKLMAWTVLGGLALVCYTVMAIAGVAPEGDIIREVAIVLVAGFGRDSVLGAVRTMRKP